MKFFPYSSWIAQLLFRAASILSKNPTRYAQPKLHNFPGFFYIQYTLDIALCVTRFPIMAAAVITVPLQYQS
jgi:hypothetical protein